MWRAKRDRRDSRGAAAVELALVCIVLFPLLFGILDYGLWFNDTLNVRQGVREGARAGVVQNFSTGTCSTGSQMAQLACRTKAEVGAATGTTSVRILTPDGWHQRDDLVVCAIVHSTGVTGLVPLPHDGLIFSKTHMSIEDADPVPGTTSYTTDEAPNGGSWSWCD